MPIRTLMIRWTYAKEYIDLDKVVLHDLIETKEYWPSMNILVTYKARVHKFYVAGNTTTIALRYNFDEQTDKYIRITDNEARMGLSVITINDANNTASAEWADDDDTTFIETVSAVIIGTQTPYSHLRRIASVVVTLRSKQQEMREQLLYFDKGRCVISGETEKDALEAAHVVPVSAGGSEVAENAILLRADLHRLFDAGLIWFEIEKERATVRTSKALSPKYRNLLDGKTLNGDTFVRVKTALEARAGLGLRQ